MNRWQKIVAELQPLLGSIAACPECGDTTLDARAHDADVPMIASSRGVSIPFRCAYGHVWSLRISSWYVEERHRAATAPKLKRKQKQLVNA